MIKKNGSYLLHMVKFYTYFSLLIWGNRIRVSRVRVGFELVVELYFCLELGFAYYSKLG